MSKVTVYQIDNRFFLPVENGMREIPFSIINEWSNQGSEIEIREVEKYV